MDHSFTYYITTAPKVSPALTNFDLFSQNAIIKGMVLFSAYKCKVIKDFNEKVKETLG